MVLQIDTSAPLLNEDELTELVNAIVGAGQDESEPDWVEWKSDADLRERRWQATAAKHVLGMSNRRPESASHSVGGYGYVVFGAEPGGVGGIERVDNADLQNWLSRFVEDDRARWRPAWLEVSGASVLILVVDPPQDGDKIASLAQQFEDQERGTTWPEGTIFVRRNGQTDRARPREIDMLVERACGAVPEPEVTLHGAGRDPSSVGVRLRPKSPDGIPYQARLAILAPGLEPRSFQPFVRGRPSADGWWTESWHKSESDPDVSWDEYVDSLGRVFSCPDPPPTGDAVWVVLSYELPNGEPSSLWQRFGVEGSAQSWGLTADPLAPAVRVRGRAPD